MAAPVNFHPTPQRTTTDCVLACLAMMLTLDYLEVQRAASRTKAWEKGLNVPETIRVAKRLGRGLSRLGLLPLPPQGWDEQQGILFLRRARTYHAVVLFNGCVYDPSDGVVWELDAYLAVSGYKPYTLLLP